MTSHADLKEMVAAYVLGALPEDEMRMLRTHVLSCEECMADADGHARALDPLLLAVDPVPLPVGFQDRVLEAIRPESATETRVQSRRPWSLKPVVGVAVGALALVLVLLTVGLVDARFRLTDTEEKLASARALTNAVLAATQGIEMSGDGEIVAKVIPAEEGALFVATGLGPAPARQTYQLWFLRDGEPTSAGTFDSADDIAVLRIPRSLDGVDGAAVTIERAGGAPAPTSEPIIGSA